MLLCRAKAESIAGLTGVCTPTGGGGGWLRNSNWFHMEKTNNVCTNRTMIKTYTAASTTHTRLMVALKLFTFSGQVIESTQNVLRLHVDGDIQLTVGVWILRELYPSFRIEVSLKRIGMIITLHIYNFSEV